LHPLHASGAAVRRKKITSAFDGGVMLPVFADPHRIPRCERSERVVLGTCLERRFLSLIKPNAKALATLFEYLAGRKPTEAEKAENV
jgi:hypothetical protein